MNKLVMNTFRSTKVKDGYSCCFRQWKATHSHCSTLHGYSPSVEFTFEGELDEYNWVSDFAAFKHAKSLIGDKTPNQWLSWLLDHTVLVAQDDPEMGHFVGLDAIGVIQLRIVPAIGAERFAEFIGRTIQDWVQRETNGRVRLASCKFMEHNKNSATYYFNI